MKEVIRIEDAIASESNYVVMKFKEKVKFIELEARCFPSNKITISMTKCIHGYNHYRVRDILINGNRVTSKCPWYNEEEIWEYVVQCKYNR